MIGSMQPNIHFGMYKTKVKKAEERADRIAKNKHASPEEIEEAQLYRDRVRQAAKPAENFAKDEEQARGLLLKWQ